MEFLNFPGGVIGYAIEVHRMLGPGLLESTYRQCLAHELFLANIQFRMELPLPVEYEGIQVDCGYRMDVLVNGDLLLELKSVEALLPIHQAQILSYMCHAEVPIGLLINFNVLKLANGIKRFVL